MIIIHAYVDQDKIMAIKSSNILYCIVNELQHCDHLKKLGNYKDFLFNRFIFKYS